MQTDDVSAPDDGHGKTKAKPTRLSDIVKSIDTQQDVTIGQLVDSLGERAFGALMFIFAVPNIIPTPPGTSAILGLPLVILTYQVMMGRQSLWLPQTVRKRQISRNMLQTFVSKVLPVMGRLERILRPRFGFADPVPAHSLRQHSARRGDRLPRTRPCRARRARRAAGLCALGRLGGDPRGDLLGALCRRGGVLPGAVRVVRGGHKLPLPRQSCYPAFSAR